MTSHRSLWVNLRLNEIERINAAINADNPFETLAIVRESDVWDGSFPDVTTLNAHASDAVLKALDRLRSSAIAHQKITAIAIAAGKGVGKSHAIARLRRHLQADDRAMFVYAGVEKYDINAIASEFQQTLVQSLDRPGSHRVTQWQELASFMATVALRSRRSEAPAYDPGELVARLNHPQCSADRRYRWVDKITTLFLSLPRSQRLDPDLVRAIFWTLVNDRSLYALKWLSGKDLSHKKARELSLPQQIGTGRDFESQALDNILQITSLITDCKSLLICFDELDLPENQRSKAGLTRPHAVAGFIKTLVDSLNLSSTSQGVAILSVMMPDTWSQKVKLMPGGVSDRISASSIPISLNYIDGDAIVQLVSLWLAEFYRQRDLTPPTPVYPFTEDRLRNLGANNSVRQVLKWCANHFKVVDKNDERVGSRSPQQPAVTAIQTLEKHPVEAPYQKEIIALEGTRELWLDDRPKIANALTLGLNALKGKTIADFTLDRIEQIPATSGNRDSQGKSYIDFKIIGTENENAVKIGVAIVQQSNHSSIKAALNRLVNYSKFDLSRGCLLRSHPLNSKTYAKQYLEKLLSPQMQGKWVQFQPTDMKPLLAIWAVYRGQGDYQLSDRQILNFIEARQIAIGNPILREILAKPSQQLKERIAHE